MRSLVVLCVMGSGGVALAAPDATASFDAMKRLAGHWEAHANEHQQPFTLTYDVGSNGSIVEEHFGKELSVVHLDGDKLAFEHYCNAGNQPRLVLAPESTASRLVFEATSTTNLKAPDAAHVQRILYTFADPSHMTLELVWKRGAGLETEKYAVTKTSK